jgi:hypothetical protein
MKIAIISIVLFASAVSVFLTMPACAQMQNADHNSASNGTAPLKLVATFEFPSDEGGFDHLIADIPGRWRLSIRRATNILETSRSTLALVGLHLRSQGREFS